VRTDIELLRKAPELAGSIEKFQIGGYAYDLETATVTARRHRASTPRPRPDGSFSTSSRRWTRCSPT
jgi:hypothetical protein